MKIKFQSSPSLFSISECLHKIGVIIIVKLINCVQTISGYRVINIILHKNYESYGRALLALPVYY